MKITGNEPASPVTNEIYYKDIRGNNVKAITVGGLTIRQQFAMAAMQSVIMDANPPSTKYICHRLGIKEEDYSYETQYKNFVALLSVNYADALINKLNKMDK